MAFNAPNFILNDDDIPKIPCKYYSPAEFSRQLSRCIHPFSLLGLNIRSLRKNFASLLAFLATYLLKFTLIILFETWLSDTSDYGFDVSGYAEINIHRNNLGGGIKVYYQKDYNIEIMNELCIMDRIAEVLTFSISCNLFKYIICCVYRPPSYNPNAFYNLFFNQILIRLPHNSDVIVVGDFNYNLYNPLKLNYIQEFVENMLSFNLFPVLTIPTMIHENNVVTKYSLIDQIWSNFKKGLHHLGGVIDYLISDHLPMFYIFSCNFKPILKTITLRPISDENIHNFLNVFNNEDLNNIRYIDDPNIAFNSFYNKLYDIYTTSFPTKRKKVKHRFINEPWITPTLKKCIRKKFYLYNLLKRGLITRKYFNNYKRLLIWVTKKIKNRYFQEKFSGAENNVRKTWQNINTVLRRKNKTEINKLIDLDGRLFTKESLTNKFNDYFTGIAQNLLNNIQMPLNNAFLNYFDPVLNSCFLYPTNNIEVFNILMSLSNKGNPIYSIKPSLLKLLNDKLIPILTYLYNFCISKGVYPDSLKTARVVPTHKSGSTSDVSNFRPISNLCPLNKIFELLTKHRLENFLDQNGILSNLQFGFRPSSNTSLAIFTLLKDFACTFNRKNYTIALFVDLKKAFDLIDRAILMKKLYRYGFRGIAGDFLMSYLTNRKQFVSIDGYESSLLNIDYGVPQGSVLGPILFNIFINDLVNLPQCKKVLFADDTVLYVSDDNFGTCIEKIKSVINSLVEWLKVNRLVLNVSKSKLMLVTPRPKPQLPQLFVGGTRIDWVSSIIYLGMCIDDRLSFTEHVNDICNKLNKFCGITYSLSTLVPDSSLLVIYNSLIYPLILQNIIIWGGISEIHKNRIQVAMNKILRNILKVKFNENHVPLMSVNEMFKKLQFLKFKDIHEYFMLKFFHLIYYNRHDVFLENFAQFLPLNNYNTRNSRINLPDVRTDTEKKFTIFQCCCVVRRLPEYLLLPQSMNSLKKNFKKYAIDKY